MAGIASSVVLIEVRLACAVSGSGIKHSVGGAGGAARCYSTSSAGVLASLTGKVASDLVGAGGAVGIAEHVNFVVVGVRVGAYSDPQVEVRNLIKE
jgi:hypothetical protein